MAISKIVTNSVDSGVTLTSPTLVTPVLSGSVTGTYTLAGTGTLSSPTISAPVLSGSVTGTYTLAGTPTAGASLITSGTAQATTSGTFKDFTSIPSWVKRITVMFSGVSTNGTSNPLIQIGAGSVINTGYLSAGNSLSASSDVTAYTTGFGIRSGNAGNLFHGQMTLCLLNASAYVWTSSHGGATTTNNSSYVGGGSITLSGTLDRVRITTVNGTDTFDAGSINILYE